MRVFAFGPNLTIVSLPDSTDRVVYGEAPFLIKNSLVLHCALISSMKSSVFALGAIFIVFDSTTSSPTLVPTPSNSWSWWTLPIDRSWGGYSSRSIDLYTVGNWARVMRGITYSPINFYVK